MSDAHDQAVELVLSELGGEVIPDDDGQADDDGVDLVVVLHRGSRRGKRGRKSAQPSPGQVGLF